MTSSGTKAREIVYGGTDPRDAGAYTVPDVAHLVGVSPSTVRYWVVGQPYYTSMGRRRAQPLVPMADRASSLLSFNNLIEVFVLRALRADRDVHMAKIRASMRVARRVFQVDRLLLAKDLLTGGGDLFLDDSGDLVALSQGGQGAMRSILERYLTRIEWGFDKLPMRFFPSIAGEPTEREPKLIVIDPNISFGRPTIRRRHVSTAVLASRFASGESLGALMGDYGLTEEEVEGAIAFERRAA